MRRPHHALTMKSRLRMCIQQRPYLVLLVLVTLVAKGDFKAKVGIYERIELKIEPHKSGRRNHKRQILINFLESKTLFLGYL